MIGKIDIFFINKIVSEEVPMFYSANSMTPADTIYFLCINCQCFAK